MSDARERAIEAINEADGPARYDGAFAVEAIEAAGLRIVDATGDNGWREKQARVDDAAGASTGVRPGDLHDGGVFVVPFICADGSPTAGPIGAWMVYLPTGLGVAHAEHRTLLENRVACVREISDTIKGVTT